MSQVIGDESPAATATVRAGRKTSRGTGSGRDVTYMYDISHIRADDRSI